MKSFVQSGFRRVKNMNSRGQVFLTLVYFTLSVSSQKILNLEEDEICHKSGTETWKCKLASRCTHINLRETRPPICGFKGRNPIVCCRPPGIQRPTDNRRPQDNLPQNNKRPSSGPRIAEQKCSLMLNTCQLSTLSLPPKRGYSNRRRGRAVTNSSFIDLEDLLPNLDDLLENEENKEEGNTTTVIVGGVNAPARKYKALVLLGYGKTKNKAKWVCGGSLITARHVLSAAHCTETSIGRPKWARVGELDLSTDKDDAKPQDREIVKWVDHPDYKPPMLYNDISIYTLQRNVDFTDWVAPVCLHTSPDIPAPKATVIGFGRLGEAEDVSRTLQEVQISIVSGNNCKRLFGQNPTQTPRGIDPASMVCAGEKEGGKDACLGDSGGPMMIEEQGKCLRTLIGITSFGKGCGAPNVPGIYTRVYFYLNWIERNVWPSG